MASQWGSQSIVERIQAFATLYSTRLACKLPSGGKSLTYGEMMGKSRAIADALTTSGCTNTSVVAVYQEPTPDWLCSLLAVFSVGATCVPFDAGTLVERLTVMAKDSNVSIVLTDSFINVKDVESLTSQDSRKIINVDQISNPHQSSKTIFPRPSTSRPEDPAVILYTSGSTGK